VAALEGDEEAPAAGALDVELPTLPDQRQPDAAVGGPAVIDPTPFFVPWVEVRFRLEESCFGAEATA
jgi:hypothetical protein